MSDTYIIEVRSKAAGIVVREQGGYRFFAATHDYNRLEGQLFRNAREAERAAMQIAGGGLTSAAQGNGVSLSTRAVVRHPAVV
jgi:hypothetical protein